jgi:RHS repeat-associated protein
MGYYVTDMVTSQAQAAATRSWTLDPAGRLRAAAASGAPTKTNHYDDPSSDSPSWIDEATGAAALTATRYVTGLDGNLVATIASTGTTWQLVNLHGDIVTTSTDDATLTTPDGPTLDADEYGNPRGTTTPRCGWLGGKQRSTDNLAGLVLMGVRLYNPVLGRFLQTDPQPGGSCNDYDYSCADPINAYDLDGKWPHFHHWGTVFHIGLAVAAAADLLGCFVCDVGLAVYGGYSVSHNLYRHRYRAAAWDAVGLATFGWGTRARYGARSAMRASRYWRGRARGLRTRQGSTCRRHLRRSQHWGRRAAYWGRHEQASRWVSYGHYSLSLAYSNRAY